MELDNLTTYNFHDINSPIIYFLFNKDELVYIGQSKKGLRRIYEHTDKEFTSIKIIPCELNNLDTLEEELIMEYCPKLNKTIKFQNYKLLSSYNSLYSFIAKRNNIKIHVLNNKEFISVKDIKLIDKIIKSTDYKEKYLSDFEIAADIKILKNKYTGEYFTLSKSDFNKKNGITMELEKFIKTELNTPKYGEV